MRLDKYLKVSRIIKRRTVANEACDKSYVTANNRPVKASYDVKIGDEICVSFGNKKVQFKVLSINEHSNKSDATSMYELIEDNQ
ncbi:MAG: RNA-binding protein [Clostridiales bacterium GWF2_38_85]|nr:MAG: RNA-binding protein [Clostridiales bacterium GWF2_38_85]HBL83900.1 RNA-binding protein [Clostridiales bacterium]